MSELVLRAKHNDHLVVEEVLSDPTSVPPRHARFIRRVVVDASAAARTSRYATVARQTGTTLLVDPQTTLLTTPQDAGDSWAGLPFATPRAVDVREYEDPQARHDLIATVVEFQIDHGATAIIPPYLHLSDPSDRTARIQRRLIKETDSYLHDDLGYDFDIFSVISIDLRSISFEPSAWEEGLGRLLRTAARAGDGAPYAIGLSASSRPTSNSLHKMSRVWRRAARLGPFVAWHAGRVGLLAVAMGAQGYEVGMCTAERHDVRAEQRNREPGSGDPGPRHTGVYLDSVGHSVSKSAVDKLRSVRSVQADLGCMDPGCCPDGFQTLLGSGRRQHSIRHRLDDLEALDAIGARGWKLHHLQVKAAQAAATADRVRKAAETRGIPIGVYPDEHQAMERVVLGLRETARIQIA